MDVDTGHGSARPAVASKLDIQVAVAQAGHDATLVGERRPSESLSRAIPLGVASGGLQGR